MRIESSLNESAILSEVGRRLAQRRISLELTQAAVAEQAGVGTATLERLEAGRSTSSSTLIRVLRVLGLIEGLDRLVPEPTLSPVMLLNTQGKRRKRASTKRRQSRAMDGGTPGRDDGAASWTWGDES